MRPANRRQAARQLRFDRAALAITAAAASVSSQICPAVGLRRQRRIAIDQFDKKVARRVTQAADDRRRHPGIGRLPGWPASPGPRSFRPRRPGCQRASQLKPHQRMRKVGQLESRARATPRWWPGGGRQAHGELPHVAFGVFHRPQQRAVVERSQPVERAQRVELGLRQMRLRSTMRPQQRHGQRDRAARPAPAGPCRAASRWAIRRAGPRSAVVDRGHSRRGLRRPGHLAAADFPDPPVARCPCRQSTLPRSRSGTNAGCSTQRR